MISMSGNRRLACGTWISPRSTMPRELTAASGSPMKLAAPRLGVMTFEMALSSVVLP